MRFIKATADPECNLLVGQRSTEMLLDVGFQHCVEVLELSVGDQANDVYLEDGKIEKDTNVVACIAVDFYRVDEELGTVI